jgi:hypothetical protein
VKWTVHVQTFSVIFGTVANNIPDVLKNLCSDLDRPWTPGGGGSQISRQSTHEGGNVVHHTHRPPIPPRWFHKVPGCRHTYTSQAWAHITGGKSAQCHVRVDQCASEIATAKVPVFLRTLSCSTNTSVARIRAGCYHVTPGILDDLCCLPYVATECGWAKVDTWPLTHGACYHVTVRFVWLALKVVFKHHAVFVELHEAYSFLLDAVSAQGHSAAGRFRSMKNSIDSIGNRTRDLPACSAQPQPNAPTRAPIPDERQQNWK